jgi:hypothetical protein
MGTSKKKIEWFGMKLTPEQKDKIRRLAKRRGVSQKKAIMDLVEKEIEEKENIEAKPGSFLEAAEDIVGSVEGPGDLSTNPKYMEGFGR